MNDHDIQARAVESKALRVLDLLGFSKTTTKHLSFRRRPESRAPWVPAYAGTTIAGEIVVMKNVIFNSMRRVEDPLEQARLSDFVEFIGVYRRSSAAKYVETFLLKLSVLAP